jgi:hypothetical protein
MSKMGLHDPFGHLQHNLWQKEKLGVKSQTGSLTPDHEMSRINPISMRAGGVRHTVGNLSTRATTLL